MIRSMLLVLLVFALYALTMALDSIALGFVTLILGWVGLAAAPTWMGVGIR